ncbi:LysR family transcriptional regulator [Celerinatantimonas yamalensis]|uniref:LysR family transcriptional regulator n=1 Tax=Celerinatantimonas yamalensis TaxID=559956 RepID=A0ABW9G6V6_9GAMM
MDLQRIDFNLLKVFRLLMQERQVSAAARRLHLSQPAVSHSLKRLRELFEDPLFIAYGRQMQPTPVAKQLALTIEQVWQTLELGFAGLEPFDPCRSERIFKLAVSASIEHAMIEPIYERLRQAGSGLTLQVSELTQKDYLQPLAEREFDVVVGFADSHHLHPQLTSEFWFSDPLYCLSAQNRAFNQQPISITQLTARAHIYTSSWGHSQTVVDQWLGEHQCQRQIALRVPSFMAVPPLLIKHPLYAVVPHSVCDFLLRDTALIAQPLPSSLTIRYCLAWHPLYQREPALNWLLNSLRALTPAVDKDAD